MNMRNTLTVALLATCAFVSGCASTWSTEQKASIKTVMVEQPTAAKDAYHVPDATKSPGMANSIPAATGGGLIPALIGSAIDASVTSKQQKAFVASSGKYFDQIRVSASEPPLAAIKAELEKRLKADEFFAQKVADTAEDRFSLTITSHGLVRSPNSPPKYLRFCYSITCQVKFKVGKDDMLIDQVFYGNSFATDSIEKFVEKPELMEQYRSEAVSQLCDSISNHINVMLGRTKQ